MSELLRRLQKTEIEILGKIDIICRENNISYSLYAGTMLGAVRHQGFIPWDDDLDICMTRENYDRFISLWNELRPEGYVLLNKQNAPGFSQSFTKIKKDHTTFLQREDLNKDYHFGIFVDVFPVDRMPDRKIDRTAFRLKCLEYQLFLREFVPPKGSTAERFISRILLGITSEKKREKVRFSFEEWLKKLDTNTDLPVVFIETLASLKKSYPPTVLDAYMDIPFESGKYMCFRDWDTMLTVKFGEYMQLPDEKERHWRHRPLIIDFDHNYEEIEDLADCAYVDEGYDRTLMHA